MKVTSIIQATVLSLALTLPLAGPAFAQAKPVPPQGQTTEQKLTLPDGMTEEDFKKLPPQIQEMIKQMSAMQQGVGDPDKLSPAQYEKIYDDVWNLVAQRDVYAEHLGNWAEWRYKFKGKLTTKAATESAIQEMLSSLGEHWTAYTSSSDIEAMKALSQEGVFDLGMMVTDRPNADGNFSVFGVIFDTPAYKSAIRKGDVILRVKNLKASSKTADWQVLNGMTKLQVEDLLRGPAKTPIFIEYSRNGGPPVQVQMVVMEPGKKEVKARMAPNGVCHVWMPQFDEESINGFINGMLTVLDKAQGNYKGCVIDFRGNPGGLFEQAKKIGALFLPQGFSVSTKTREGREVKVERIEVLPNFPFDVEGASPELRQLKLDVQKMPCVVLIDESSASASEVVTGILKGNRRCVVVGTRSWGKGMGYFPQRLPLGGQLTISSLIYYPPDRDNPQSIGLDINGVGINPDIVVERAFGDIDNQLEFAMDLILKDNGSAIDGILKSNYAPAIERKDAAANPIGTVATAGVLALILVVFGGVLFNVHVRRKRQKEAEEGKINDRQKKNKRY